MASNQNALQEYPDFDDEEEDEEEEEEEEEGYDATVAEQTRIGRVNLTKCDDSQIGHRKIFHGPVKFRTFLKITSPEAPSPNGGDSIAAGSSRNPGQITGGAQLFRYPSTTFPVIEETYTVTDVTETPNESLETSVDVETIPSSQVTTIEETGDPNDCASDETPLIPDKDDRITIKTKKLIFYGGALTVVVILLTVLVGELVRYYINNPFDVDNLPMNFTKRLITRGEWFALPPKKEMKPFAYNPLPYLVVCHTAGVACFDRQSCRVTVRRIQSGQMAGAFNDISYNYLVGGDGYIYEGRGWEEASAGVTVMDCSALSIGFIGNFVVDVPPLKQLDAFRLILQAGVEKGKFNKDYKMFMQKQIVDTESPGEALIEILREWSHWKPFDKKDIICNTTTI